MNVVIIGMSQRELKWQQVGPSSFNNAKAFHFYVYMYLIVTDIGNNNKLIASTAQRFTVRAYIHICVNIHDRPCMVQPASNTMA